METFADELQDRLNDVEPDLYSQGVMLAVCPDVEPPFINLTQGNFHVTLLTLGLIVDYDPSASAQLLRAVGDLVADWPVLSGSYAGWGIFHNGAEEGSVLVALIDVVGLAELRDHLEQELAAQGYQIGEDHGFTPHMTLATGWPGPPPDEWIVDPSVSFSNVFVCFGTSWTPIPLADFSDQQITNVLEEPQL